MQAFEPLNIRISGANQELRSSIATVIEGAMDGLGFTNVTNVDALEEDSSLEQRVTLADTIAERYPQFLSTEVMIETVSSNSELADDPSDDTDDEPAGEDD